MERREFLVSVGAGLGSLAAAPGAGADAPKAAEAPKAKGAYELPKLAYAYDALEPHIDARTMEIHHSKHHQAYVDNANKALAELPELAGLPVEDLLRQIEKVPEAKRQLLINNAGGHANHSLFWTIIGPGKGGEPKGALAEGINKSFGGYAKFRDVFSESALKRFGSGWAWLCVGKDKQLSVISTANQDSPVMQGLTPIVGLDVWEHAYYLHYQNKRTDYIAAWWNLVNWDQASVNYEKAMK